MSAALLLHYSISTHTPLAGRDDSQMVLTHDFSSFLLTRPLRDVTTKPLELTNHALISTHTPLAGRDVPVPTTGPAQQISTHTPLAGRDRKGSVVVSARCRISTHTPLAGRDLLFLAL